VVPIEPDRHPDPIIRAVIRVLIALGACGNGFRCPTTLDGVVEAVFISF
jgi:hypothetical protein